jgi:hypothetical protein
VIWIWMESHSFAQVIGSPSAPFINALAHAYGLATNYAAVSHPSLPNYIAATSGGTWGSFDDGTPSAHPLRVESIVEQARSAASYEEGMPSRCALTSTGTYAIKHNPEAYDVGVRGACRSDNRPLGAGPGSPFPRALHRGWLPALTFVTPNLCNDMHDCPVATGDRWLAS